MPVRARSGTHAVLRSAPACSLALALLAACSTSHSSTQPARSRADAATPLHAARAENRSAAGHEAVGSTRGGAAVSGESHEQAGAGTAPDICAANCSSPFASLHDFENPGDLSALVGRWLVCAKGTLPPTDQAGVEFTSDGRFIVLRRDSAGKVIRGTGNDARPMYTAGGANGTGGFEVRFKFAPYAALEGDLSDCPKRLRLRDVLQSAAPYPIAEYIFDSGIEPEGCTFPSNGCDYCGNVTCPPGASLDSACKCLQENRFVVRPESQTCDFCCGKQCKAGQFLDFQCECY